MNTAQPPAKKPITVKFQRIALIGYIGLLILIPLLLPLRGIIKDNTYTYAWANFVVMLYFIHGLTMLWVAPDELIWVLLELLFASFMFIGCTYYARHRGQELGLKIRKLKEDLADEKAANELNK